MMTLYLLQSNICFIQCLEQVFILLELLHILSHYKHKLNAFYWDFIKTSTKLKMIAGVSILFTYCKCGVHLYPRNTSDSTGIMYKARLDYKFFFPSLEHLTKHCSIHHPEMERGWHNCKPTKKCPST